MKKALFMLSIRDLIQDSNGFDPLPTKVASKFRPLRSSNAYASKTILDRHVPYITEKTPDVNGNYIYFNDHFLYSLGLALLHTDTDYQFSPWETTLWDYFVTFSNGGPIPANKELECNLLDFWLVEELQNKAHPAMETRVKG